MNCGILFASITVAIVIQLDRAGGGGALRLNLQLCRLVPLSTLIYQLLSPARSLPSVFLYLPKPFIFLFPSTGIYRLHLRRRSLKFLSLSLMSPLFPRPASPPPRNIHLIPLSSTPATPQPLLQSSAMSSSIIIWVSFSPPPIFPLSRRVIPALKEGVRGVKKITPFSPHTGKKWLQ